MCAGLRVHPDREHLIYPLGCAVILKRIKDGKQEFLHGHTNNVSCVSVSKSGLYIASGQVTFMGFKVGSSYALSFNLTCLTPLTFPMQHYIYIHIYYIMYIYICFSQAEVIIWDYEKRAIYAQLLIHKAKVEALAFSPNEKYLVSLGGQDDGRYKHQV